MAAASTATRSSPRPSARAGGARARNSATREVYKLIFAPGFSTAEKVTDVSGRGVGMDVVMRNIESLRGKVDIASTPAGPTFTVRLPLTLAIMDGMLVRVGRERYIIPTVSIRRTFCAEAEAVHLVTGRGEVVFCRGALLPVVRLYRIFEVRGCDRGRPGGATRPGRR